MVMLETLPSLVKFEKSDTIHPNIFNVNKPTTPKSPSGVDLVKTWAKRSKSKQHDKPSTPSDDYLNNLKTAHSVKMDIETKVLSGAVKNEFLKRASGSEPADTKQKKLRTDKPKQHDKPSTSSDAHSVKMDIETKVLIGAVKNEFVKRASSSEPADTKQKKLRTGTKVKRNAENGSKVVLGGKTPKTRMKTFIPGNLDKTAKYKAIMMQNKGNKTNPGGESAKPDWTILKKENKEKLKERKMKKCPSMYDKMVEAKQLWEKLRVEKGDHTGLTKAIHSLLKTHLAEVVFTHEISRVLQWLLHLGSHEMRVEIISELVPAVKKMIVSKYASKCIMKMLKYGNKSSKQLIVQSLMGNLVKWTKNVLSAPVVEFAYAEAATPLQQNQMRQEFYSDLFKLSKDDSVHGLADIFLAMPQLKDAHLSCTKKNLTKMIEKKVCHTSLFFDVLRDYYVNCSADDQNEMLGHVREMLTEMPDTDAAAEVGVQCVLRATNKEKKAIMKSFKGNVVKMANTKHIYQVVVALIHSIDDTVAFGKIVVPEMVANAKELASEPGGRSVLTYLTVHQEQQHWSGNRVLPLLKSRLQGGASKKASDVRQKDIVGLVAAPLLDSVAADVSFWLADTKISPVTLAIFKSGSGEPLERAYKILCEFVCDSGKTMSFRKDSLSLLEHPGIHWLLKRLVKLDHVGAGKLFASVVAEHLSPAIIEYWLTCCRGAFLLVLLLETGNPAVTEKVANKLQPFAEELKKPNAASTVKDIIVRKLSEEMKL